MKLGCWCKDHKQMRINAFQTSRTSVSSEALIKNQVLYRQFITYNLLTRQQLVASSPGGPSKAEEEAELRRRRRTDFMEDVSEDNDYVKHFYDNQRNPNGAVGAVFRRKRFDDLKSVSQRKEESKQVEQQIESWLNR